MLSVGLGTPTVIISATALVILHSLLYNRAERFPKHHTEENPIRHATLLLTVVSLLLALVLVGCSGSGSDQSGEHGSGEESRERSTASESGEHSGGSDSSERGAESESGEHDGGSESGDGAEESGTQYTLSETFDHVRAGARLVLSYDSAGNAFTGKVENTTSDKLDLVRVEVHLSNGIELGPTTPVDLAPGQTVEVTLQASSQPFVSWSAHPEVGGNGGSSPESLEHVSRPVGSDQGGTPNHDRVDDDSNVSREEALGVIALKAAATLYTEPAAPEPTPEATPEPAHPNPYGMHNGIPCISLDPTQYLTPREQLTSGTAADMRALRDLLKERCLDAYWESLP